MTEGEISACLVKHNELRRMASCFFSPPSKESKGRKKKSPLSFSFFFLTEWQPRQRRRCCAPKKERREKKGTHTATNDFHSLSCNSFLAFLCSFPWTIRAAATGEKKKTLPTALPSTSSFPSVAPSCLAKSLLLTRERKRGFPSLSRPPLPFHWNRQTERRRYSNDGNGFPIKRFKNPLVQYENLKAKFEEGQASQAI